jgi:hypothetical protein
MLKSQREPDPRHRVHHPGEVVDDDERAQEQIGVRDGQSDTKKLSLDKILFIHKH